MVEMQFEKQDSPCPKDLAKLTCDKRPCGTNGRPWQGKSVLIVVSRISSGLNTPIALCSVGIKAEGILREENIGPLDSHTCGDLGLYCFFYRELFPGRNALAAQGSVSQSFAAQCVAIRSTLMMCLYSSSARCPCQGQCPVGLGAVCTRSESQSLPQRADSLSTQDRFKRGAEYLQTGT